MPPSEYTSTGGGLKLKGAKSAGVDKKKKKSKKDKSSSTEIAKASASATPDVETKSGADAEASTLEREGSEDTGREGAESGKMKTDAERHADEIRRRRASSRIGLSCDSDHHER